MNRNDLKLFRTLGKINSFITTASTFDEAIHGEIRIIVENGIADNVIVWCVSREMGNICYPYYWICPVDLTARVHSLSDGIVGRVCDKKETESLTDFMSEAEPADRQMLEGIDVSSVVCVPFSINNTIEQSFDKNAFCGYPRVVISEESLNGLMTESEEYGELSDRMMTAVDQAAQSYASQKNADIRASADRMEKMLAGTMPENGTEGGAARFGGIFAALECIRDYEVFTASRRMNASYAGIRSVMDTFDKMQYSLVILFVIIGTLVCYSTITRLVHDQTVMIGTKKAIGFFASDILKPFLIYSAITVVLGTVFGVLLGRFVIEPITVESVRSTYRFNRTLYYYSIRDVLIFGLIYAALILATAFIASVSVSRQQPLKFLTGESETSGSKYAWLDRMPFWNRTSLLTKTIVRNCFNDHRRVFATLIGVLGCTALVVCALSMYNNLVGSFDLTMSETVPG